MLEHTPWRHALVVYDITTESALWRVSSTIREALPEGSALESTSSIDGVQSVLFRLAGPLEIADGESVRDLLCGLGVASTSEPEHH